jgi:hypothetical protein
VTGSDPAELAGLARFLAVRGRKGVGELLARVESYPELLAAIRSDGARPGRPVVLVFTDRMLREYHVNHRHGHWDFEAATGPLEPFEDGTCQREGDVLACRSRRGREFRFDPERGTLDGEARVERSLVVGRSGVVEETRYPHAGDTYVEILEGEAGAPVKLVVLREPAFRSVFNRMFLLGEVDARRFRMIYDDFPTTRAFLLEP